MRATVNVVLFGALVWCVSGCNPTVVQGYVADAVNNRPIVGATIIVGKALPYFDERASINPDVKVIDIDGPVPFLEWGRVKSDENGWFHWKHKYGAVTPRTKLVFKIVKEGYEPLYPTSRTTPLDPVTERKDDGTPIWRLKPLKSDPSPTRPD